MPDIGSRSFIKTPTTDKYLSLKNEEWARTMLIGNNWTKIRIGVQVAMGSTGATIPSIQMVIGACSGTVAPFSTHTTTNFVGVSFGSNTAQLGDYTFNSGTNPFYTWTGPQRTRRVGSTLTTGNGTSGGFYTATNTGTLQRRQPVYVDITKGSPNYTLNSWSFGTGSTSTDFSYDEFLMALQTVGTPAPASNTMYDYANGTIACSEADGNLDSISIYWNSIIVPLEVYAIDVFRMA